MAIVPQSPAVNLAGRVRRSAAGAHLGAVGARRHQLWVREVHDEDGARPVARVAHLVLERVVEDERGALLPPAWGGDGCWD